jgi:arginyl-tRNA synthetase
LKQEIQTLLTTLVQRLIDAGELPIAAAPSFVVEPPRNPEHGDFSTNLAMVLAKPCRKPPLELARSLVAALEAPTFVDDIAIAPPGFINFRLKSGAMLDVIAEIVDRGESYGESQRGPVGPVQIEFVSANPTGPLHVGHGRGAAYGSALARLLRATGCEVRTEYYVNDAGRQMDILALSVWLRYLENLGVAIEFPGNAYRGEYIRDIAAALAARDGDRYRVEPALPTEASHPDPEARLDAAIAACRAALGEAAYRALHGLACESILAGIREDLAAFGVDFDLWYSERSLWDTGKIDAVLDRLRAHGHLYVKDGAQWFASSSFGDEKDRVVIRDNGLATYFASDIAYHAEKFERGFTHVLDVWGADHHGYIPRVRAALTALDEDAARLEVLLVQFAALYRGGERVQMSTRSGEFVTLRELIDEVGADAARFFYIMRRSDQHLDFDLDLAKSQSQDNPVYYLQYAHARICSIFRQAEQSGPVDVAAGVAVRASLVEKREQSLAALLLRMPDVVADAARDREPHQVANYLREVAVEFHAYYNAHKILTPEPELRAARLALCAAVRIVLANGLRLLGVTAPAEM